MNLLRILEQCDSLSTWIRNMKSCIAGPCRKLLGRATSVLDVVCNYVLLEKMPSCAIVTWTVGRNVEPFQIESGQARSRNLPHASLPAADAVEHRIIAALAPCLDPAGL